MRALVALSIACCAAFAATAVQAQNMKPGLWEIKQKPQLDPQHQAQMAQMQKQMAAMPPEQRKMMEQMMSQRGIQMDMSGSGGGAITIKTCVSKEQAERNTPPVTDKGKCTYDTQRSGNMIRTKFSCKEPVSEGEAEVTLKGSDGYTNKVTVRHQRNGRVETTIIDGEARWLGSDCGTLKPIGTQP